MTGPNVRMPNQLPAKRTLESRMLPDRVRMKAWGDFMRAVHEGQRGNYAPAREIVERVRTKHGDAAADAQRRELWRLINSGQPEKSK